MRMKPGAGKIMDFALISHAESVEASSSDTLRQAQADNAAAAQTDKTYLLSGP